MEEFHEEKKNEKEIKVLESEERRKEIKSRNFIMKGKRKDN